MPGSTRTISPRESELFRQQTRLYAAQADLAEREKANPFAPLVPFSTLLATLTAFLTVGISAISVAKTTAATRRGQLDIQVNEALNRLGNTESAPSRANAAITLAHVGTEQRPWFRPGSQQRLRTVYYRVAYLQILTAIKFERDMQVIDSYALAVSVLTQAHDSTFISAVREIEAVLQDRIVRTAIRYSRALSEWFEANRSNMDQVSNIERNAYTSLSGVAMNFKEHPATFLNTFAGVRIEEAQALVLSNAIVRWKETSFVESFFPVNLSPTVLQSARQQMRGEIRKLRILNAAINGTKDDGAPAVIFIGE